MFGKILGKLKSDSTDGIDTAKLIHKVSNMTLSEMRNYVNNKLKDYEVCEDGIITVMQRLNSIGVDKKRFIENDAMDSKIKKAFDLVILVANNKKTTIVAIELIQEFTEIYRDLISEFDKNNKQIYTSKFKDAISSSTDNIQKMTEMNQKMKVLGE